MPASSRRRRRPSFRRLDIQQLETRSLLATFTVSTLSDVSDGVFTDGNQSLREAVERANLTPAADVINFKAGLTGTINLSGTGLTVTNPLAINGPGANLVTVSGGGAVRVFYVHVAGKVSISGLAVSNGNAIGFAGGGIAADAGSELTLDRMYIHDNVATQGGAVATVGARLTILNSTIAANAVNHQGGGIYHDGSDAHDAANPSLRVINSTISRNNATNEGGGVYVFDGAAQFRSSTIVLNQADFGHSGAVLGGGLWTWGASNASSTIYNTIVAGNFVGPGAASDIANKNVEAASANNLIGDAASAGGLTHNANGNLVGDNGAGIKAIDLIIDAALANNGGSTPTHAVVPGSAALDAGNAAFALDQNGAALTKDQRGFTRIVDGPDAGTVATIDIGAYEASKRTFVVDTLVDEIDYGYGPNDLSLREALDRANANAGPDVINFAPGLTGTMLIKSNLTPITDSVVVNGPGADRLTIDGDDRRVLFRILNAGGVTLSGLAITRGQAESGGGGGVRVVGTTAILDRLYVHENDSGYGGGGIAVRGGGRPTYVTLLNSSVSQNMTDGGILATGGTAEGPVVVRVINSTISGNGSAIGGGGLNVGTATVIVRNSTITGNVDNIAQITNSRGGGIFTYTTGTTTLFNSIVAGNRSFHPVAGSDDEPHDIGGKNLEGSSANNLIGTAATSGGLLDGVNGNIVGNNGTGTIDINTVIHAALVNNGGGIPTHQLTLTSPAIDQGKNSFAVNQQNAALTLDQRGRPRIADRNHDGTATVDIGAVELQPITIGLSGTIKYTENGAPLVLASGAGFSALDTATFATGKLTVTNAAAPHVDDRLVVLYQGNAAGQVGVSGNEVRFGGVLIGTKAGGSGGTPLVVTFNGSATAAAIQAVIRRVAFSSASENPPQLRARFVSWSTTATAASAIRPPRPSAW